MDILDSQLAPELSHASIFGRNTLCLCFQQYNSSVSLRAVRRVTGVLNRSFALRTALSPIHLSASQLILCNI